MTEIAVSEQPGVAHGELGIAPNTAEFKRRSVRGGAAVVVSQGATMGLQLITTVVLARLLSPADYGLQAMVLTLVGFVSLFKDAGLSIASVQKDTVSQDQISTLFWINIAVGAFLTILVASAGPVLVAFYKDPRLLWITAASASVFLINSFAVQHRALLDRAMRFTTSVKIDILSCTIGTAVAIVMAALGFGYWALICQNISLPLVATIATWIAVPWMPGRPRWSQELRSMMRFGGTVTLNGVVVYLAYNAEKILLGRFWGAAALGIYGRAYQLTNMPMQQLMTSVGSVAFPMLSRLQGNLERLRRSYLKAHSLVVSLTVPVVISCAMFADDIIQTVLGPKWNAAAPILRLLSPAILIFALMNPMSWLLRATGRVGRSLKIALVICPVMILGVVAGLRYGPKGVALGYSAAIGILAVPLIAWAKRGTGITFADFWDCIKRPLGAGLLAGLAAGMFRYYLHTVLGSPLTLILEIAILFGVYGLILLFAMGQKEMYYDLFSHLFQRKRLAEAQG